MNVQDHYKLLVSWFDSLIVYYEWKTLTFYLKLSFWCYMYRFMYILLLVLSYIISLVDMYESFEHFGFNRYMNRLHTTIFIFYVIITTNELVWIWIWPPAWMLTYMVDFDFSCSIVLFILSFIYVNKGYLVDPASSDMLVSKIKPCKSKYKSFLLMKLRTAH